MMLDLSKQWVCPSTMVNLVCPICHCALEAMETGMQCLCCRRVFPVRGAVLCFSEQDRTAWDNNTRHQSDLYAGQYMAQMSAPVLKRSAMAALHVLTFKMAQIDRFVSGFQLRDDSRILEVGCGDGWFLRWLHNRYHVKGVGVDISPAAVNLAIISDWAGNEYYAAEASQLPFDDSSFDLVCSLDVLEHLTHERKRVVLEEMVRVLKPGGDVLLYILHTDDKYTDFWFKRTWARLRGGDKAVHERERKAYEQESGHLRSNFISVQAMRVLTEETGLDIQVLPFHAICTSIHDMHIVGFIINPLMNLINRAYHMWRPANPSVISPEASTNAPVVSQGKKSLVKIYHPIFSAGMKLACAVDRPFIARGHFAGMFVIGRKRV